MDPFANNPLYGRSVNRTGDIYQPTGASVIATRKEYILTNSWRWLPACPVEQIAAVRKGR